MRKLVVLVSGRGSNMRAIVEARARRDWPATIAAVIASRRDAPALALARELGVPAEVVDHRDFPDRAAYDDALARAVDAHAPDFVLLAGFMRILGDAFIDRYSDRLVNIHPSLLPAFPGLDTHRRALAAGAAVAGATVHQVTRALDGGPILAQAVVPVLAGDDPQRLADRVLQAEHRVFPMVIEWLLAGRLVLTPAGPDWYGEPPVRCLGLALTAPDAACR